MVEGLEGGERFALISKVHHCMVDGISGAELMTVLMGLEPDAVAEYAPPFVPRPAPSRAELARDELLELAGTPFAAGREFGGLLAAPRSAPSSATRCAARDRSCSRAWSPPRARRSTARSARTAASSTSRSTWRA